MTFCWGQLPSDPQKEKEDVPPQKEEEEDCLDIPLLEGSAADVMFWLREFLAGAVQVEEHEQYEQKISSESRTKENKSSSYNVEVQLLGHHDVPLRVCRIKTTPCFETPVR